MKVAALAEAFDSAKDVFDVLFEAKLEHLIGLVKDDSLNVTEVNVAAIEMVQNATCCAHENFAAIFKLVGLIFHGNTAVDSSTRVLHRVVLNIGEDLGDLDCKFTCRRKHDSLGFARRNKIILSQVFSDRESKG